MQRPMKSIRLIPKNTVDFMTMELTLFSVHNLTFKNKLRILFSKRVWFRMSKADLRRLAR